MTVHELKQSLYLFNITYLTVRKYFSTSWRVARYDLKAAFVSRIMLSNNKDIAFKGRAPAEKFKLSYLEGQSDSFDVTFPASGLYSLG